MVVGVLRLILYCQASHSLKEKRSVVRKIKSRVRNEFNVSVAECAEQDQWQTIVLAVCQVGSDHAYVEGTLQAVTNFIERLHVAELGETQVEILHY